MSNRLHFLFTYYKNIILFVVCFVELLETIQATIAPKFPIFKISKYKMRTIYLIVNISQIFNYIYVLVKNVYLQKSFVFVLRQKHLSHITVILSAIKNGLKTTFNSLISNTVVDNNTEIRIALIMY